MMSTKSFRGLLVLLALNALIGCSTKLKVRAIPTLAPVAGDEVAWAAEPSGLVVNRRATYAVHVTVNESQNGLKPLAAASGKSVTLIDPHQVLEVDYLRMPFANGKLTLELIKDAQTIGKAGVSGTTPVTNVVKSAGSTLGGAVDVKAAKEAD